METLQETVLRWLLTYALHSTALIAAVWLLIKGLPRESNRAKESLWRCALLGPILTASLQTAWQFEPLAGRLHLPPTSQGAEPTPENLVAMLPRVEALAFERNTTQVEGSMGLAPSRPEAIPSASSKRSVPTSKAHSSAAEAKPKAAVIPRIQPSAQPPAHSSKRSSTATSQTHNAPALVVEETRPLPLPSPTIQTEERAPTPLPAVLAATSVPQPSSDTWPLLLLGAWLLGGSLGLILLLLAWQHILERLSGRRELHEGPLLDALETLTERAGLGRRPRLCVSPRLTSPATIGVWRPQICVPERALTELSQGQQTAMLGHELAHILRNDPKWFFLYRLVERLLFFQPLNRVARRELQELAEFQCDDWACAQTGRGLDLARCLTEVAGWLVREAPQVALLPMAGRGSQLGHRVRRLLDEESRIACVRPRPWATPLASGLLLVGTFALPGAAGQLRSEPDNRQESPNEETDETQTPLPAIHRSLFEGRSRSPMQAIPAPAAHFGGWAPWMRNVVLESVVLSLAKGAHPSALAQDNLELPMVQLSRSLVDLQNEIEAITQEVADIDDPEAFQAALDDLQQRSSALQTKQLRLRELLARLR